ncbi:MAG: alpha amylase C-terminal domain-containing protein [Bacilli bacterium]
MPWLGRWREVINTDAKCYGGGGSGNGGYVDAVEKEAFGKPFSAKLVLPPLSTLILRCDRESPTVKKPDFYGYLTALQETWNFLCCGIAAVP